MYENSKFDLDYPQYTEEDIQDVNNYGREIGIEEMYDNFINIKHDECDQEKLLLYIYLFCFIMWPSCFFLNFQEYILFGLPCLCAHVLFMLYCLSLSYLAFVESRNCLYRNPLSTQCRRGIINPRMSHDWPVILTHNIVKQGLTKSSIFDFYTTCEEIIFLVMKGLKEFIISVTLWWDKLSPKQIQFQYHLIIRKFWFYLY